MNLQQLIGAMAEGIATFEGFYKKNSVAQRLNNPGNLMYKKQPGAKPHPIKGSDGKIREYAEFADLKAGWKAFDAQIARNIERGVTLFEFFAGQRDETGEVIPNGYPGWAPAADQNRPSTYSAFVASFVKKNYGWNLKRDAPLKGQVQG